MNIALFGLSHSETIGYMASLIIILSFVMKDIKKLRITNTLGCGLFVYYGILLNMSWPIIATNSIISIINIYYLIKK